MNKTDIMKKASLAVNKAGFALKKHSPEILAGVGVVGTVASAVLACKATTKVGDIMDDTKTQVREVHLVMQAAGIEEQSECTADESEKLEVLREHEAVQNYTVEDSRKDLTIIYAQTALKFVKLYAPAVILGTFSLGCMLTSNNILRKRNAALAAAYATIDRGFKEYRSRVVERFGEEVDRELKYNVKAQEIEETITDKNGKEKKVTKTVKTVDPAGVKESDYARFFDPSCRDWQKNAEYNLMFLRSQQQYANDLLQARGYVYLNEVYEMLDIDKTEAGQVVGWVLHPTDPVSGDKYDNYIDFGIYDLDDERKRAFVNGYEQSILLDFNVDGYILDKTF